MEKPNDVEIAEAMATAAEKLIKETETKETWKEKFMRLAMALIYEKKSNGRWTLSIGRVSWWVAFLPAAYIWVDSMGKQDITPHHLTVLLLLAGYNFGKHGLEVLKKKMAPAAVSDGPG